MVPHKLQIAVYRAYRPGQEIDKEPSFNYLLVMWRAIMSVAQRENVPLAVFKEDLQQAEKHFGVTPPALAQAIKEAEEAGYGL